MRYLLLAGIGGLVIGMAVIWGIWFYYDDIGGLLGSLWPWEWGSAWIDYVADGLTFIVLIVLFFLIYKYLIFIFLAPLMSVISQRVERHLKGEIHDSGMSFPGEIARGLKLTFRNILREVLLTLLLVVVSFILPWLAWLTAMLIFIVQAYFAGFGNMDYTLERYTDTSQAVDFIKRNRGFAIGNGAVFLLLLSIPLLGMFIAPFFGAVGATIGTLDLLETDTH